MQLGEALYEAQAQARPGMLAVSSFRPDRTRRRLFSLSAGDIPIPSSLTRTVAYMPARPTRASTRTALPAVLDGILHEIGKHDGEASLSASTPTGAGPRVAPSAPSDRHGDPLLRGLSMPAADFLEYCPDIHGRPLQREVAGLDGREVQKLVHHRPQGPHAQE